MGERATLEVDTNRRSGRATYMMTFRGSLGLVAIFGLFSMAAASPWFYHGLEGPSFTEKNTTSSGLEIRSYPESYWTATTVTGKNMDSAGSEAFMRLFRYISGDNERNEKIEMTVPVLASVVPGQGPFCEENFTYHFYLPKKFQSNPPKPSDPRVTNVALPALDVAVISYPGWSNEKAVIENGRELFQERRRPRSRTTPRCSTRRGTTPLSGSPTGTTRSGSSSSPRASAQGVGMSTPFERRCFG